MSHALYAAAAKTKLDELLADFARRSRPVRVVRKRLYWHQRFFDRALRVATLGGQSAYLSHYVTTLGHTIYVPDDFDEWAPGRAWEVLRHEAVHVRQFERIGWAGMVLLYVLLPLPLGLAYFRARLELEAYTETLRATAELEGLEEARSPELHAQIIQRFTGPDYGWMWPFPRVVQRWLDEAVAQIETELSPSATSSAASELASAPRPAPR